MRVCNEKSASWLIDDKLDRDDYDSKPIRSFRCAFENDISWHFPLLDDLSKHF